MHFETFFGCIVAAVLAMFIGAWAGETRNRTDPPVRTSQTSPVSYCRAGWSIGFPEAGPNKSVIAFAPCVHTKGERNV